MQVDVSLPPKKATPTSTAPNFAANPIGVEVDPKELLARHRTGERDEELLRRPGDVPVS